jgi:hypothetical protein
VQHDLGRRQRTEPHLLGGADEECPGLKPDGVELACASLPGHLEPEPEHLGGQGDIARRQCVRDPARDAADERPQLAEAVHEPADGLPAQARVAHDRDAQPSHGHDDKPDWRQQRPERGRSRTDQCRQSTQRRG